MRTRLTVEKLAASAQYEFEQAYAGLELAADLSDVVRRTCAENHWPVPPLPSLPPLAEPAQPGTNPLGQPGSGQLPAHPAATREDPSSSSSANRTVK